MVVLSDQRFTCCFCLHVRTGTILLGVGQIIIHVVCISVMILMTMRPDLLPETGTSLSDHGGIENSSMGRMDSRAHFLSLVLRILPGVADMQDSLAVHRASRFNKPTPEGGSDLGLLSVGDSGDGPIVHKTDMGAVYTAKEPGDDSSPFTANMRPYKDDSYRNSFKNRQFSPYFALCLSTFSLAFCCFLVHGAFTRQPTHLLPFFFLHVFYFIISLLTVVNYMSSTTDVRLLLHTKNGTVFVNSTSLTFVVLSISCITLAFKAYCLGIVWDCYKYLMLANQTGTGDGLAGSWGRERFSFLPTIWSFMGAGRASVLSRRRNRSTGAAVGLGLQVTGVPDDHLANLPPPTYNQSSDLPNYDDALKIPANAYAPPPYFKPTGKSARPPPVPSQASGGGIVEQQQQQAPAPTVARDGNDEPSFGAASSVPPPSNPEV